MRIATYNIWNENKGVGNRFEQIISEIKSTDADIIGLQEVTPYFYENYISKNEDYKYNCFYQYTNELEGLAILSRYPIENNFFLNTSDKYENSAALNAIIQTENKRISFTNLHLPWNSAKAKENQTVAINRYMHEIKKEVDISILLGDFNGGLNSSVHRFLVGEQTLNGEEANPYWFELSSTYSEIHGTPLLPTLDFVHNPRWQGKNSTEIPQVADRIYVMYNSGKDHLKSVELFGTKISEINHLSASDHYGVVAEIEFA